jgi:predicted nuclease of predicted toxin-antitoxin system
VKFLADENIDRPIVERLGKERHEVLYILEIEPSISDDEVIQRANKERALLLTADKDFGDLVFRQNRIIYGVILIRLSGLSPQNKAEIVTKAVLEHADELVHNFTVISHRAVRIRKQRL